jgi:hypothetical protein
VRRVIRTGQLNVENDRLWLSLTMCTVVVPSSPPLPIAIGTSTIIIDF